MQVLQRWFVATECDMGLCRGAVAALDSGGGGEVLSVGDRHQQVEISAPAGIVGGQPAGDVQCGGQDGFVWRGPWTGPEELDVVLLVDEDRAGNKEPEDRCVG